MAPKKFAGSRSSTVPTLATKKARKPRSPMKKPEGMSYTTRTADVTRRKHESTSRRDRQRRKKARDLEEASAEEEVQEQETPRATPGRTLLAAKTRFAMAGGYIASLQYPSPSMSPRWQHPSPSHEYVNIDAHGGFNPNIALPHCPAPRSSLAYNADPSMAYAVSPGYSTLSSLRRGPLPSLSPDARSVFGRLSGDAYMKDLITTGTMASKSCTGFFTQTSGVNSDVDSSNDIGMESQQETDGLETQEDTGDMDTTEDEESATRGKAEEDAQGDKAARQGTKEDENLAEAWKSV